MQKLANILKFQHERNVNYYIRAFDTLEKTGKNTFNNAAAYFGCAWMLYRKMYLYAIITFICQTILMRLFNFLGQKITFFGDVSTGGQIGFIVSIVICIRLFGIYGNKLYYNIVKTRISENYHTLDNYQATVILPALCFALGKLSWSTMPIVALLVLYLHYNESSLRPQKDAPKEAASTITTETLKQYLDANTPTPHSKQIPTYLSCLLITAISLWLIATMPPLKTSLILAMGLSTLFPVIA